MEIIRIVLLIICAILITLVLLQSSKSEDTGNILSGSSSDLFKNRKERGSELVISRITLIFGLSFIIICFIITFI